MPCSVTALHPRGPSLAVQAEIYPIACPNPLIRVPKVLNTDGSRHDR
jgi:hypothetical protein